VLIVLEATRRTTGWILPVTAIVFLVYAVTGPFLDQIGLSLIAHRGYGVTRVIGTLFMTLEGIFGVPLDVTTTYIVLFTIYGAILEYSGAGRFFVDWTTTAIGRSGAGADGRTVTAAGYLLRPYRGRRGQHRGPQRRGVALDATCGIPQDTGGAIRRRRNRSHPGAGHGRWPFLIAEFLHISYLQVIAFAAIPAALCYASLFLMVEADSPPAGGFVRSRRTFRRSHDCPEVSALRVDCLDCRADDRVHDVPAPCSGDPPPSPRASERDTAWARAVWLRLPPTDAAYR
jgi:hypothetical protein